MSKLFDYLTSQKKQSAANIPILASPRLTPQKKQSAANIPILASPRPLVPAPANLPGNPSNLSHYVQESFAPPPNLFDRNTSSTFDLSMADDLVKSVLDPATAIGEQFRLLRAKLTLEQKQKGIRSLLITSAVPAEGKTFTACSLAAVLAQEPGKRVLLIDADMRRPMAGKDLGIPELRNKGLSDVLRGEILATDVLLRSLDSNLFFLPSGTILQNPSELLVSPKLESTLSALNTLFDWIIVDSPPVAGLADASVIAPLCDTILLVIRTGGTPLKLIQESIQRIGRDRICGVVMNRIRNIKSSDYYHRYYKQDPA